MTGTISRVLHDKNFGFIVNGSGSYFFHAADLDFPIEMLDKGDPVEFEPTATPKGPRASRLRRCES